MSWEFLLVFWGLLWYSYSKRLDCHPSCNGCFHGGADGCVDCVNSLFSWNNQCLNECPIGTYPKDQQCFPCSYPCEICRSENICLVCQQGFYKEEDNCMNFGMCSEGRYSDNETMECKECDESCLTCYGPTYKQCITCKHSDGYIMPKATDSICYLVQCIDSTYVSIKDSQVNCEECNDTCKSCNNDNTCIECKENLINLKNTCEECPLGYNFDRICKGTRLT